MHLARVIGTLVATEKYQGLESVPLLIIQPLDRLQQPRGAPLVAADSTGMAGPGELTWFTGKRGS